MSIVRRDRPSRVLAWCLSAVSVALTGCPDGTGTIVDPPTETTTCTDHVDCGEGYVCIGGECEIGECAPGLFAESCTNGTVSDENRAFCCKAWQICNFDRTCVSDPNAQVGTQCEESADCPNVGQFCSGGNCYDSTAAEPCTKTYNCPNGQRCDAVVNLCVPDLGGCKFCEAFPELCCETGFACDVETGFCIDVDVEEECTPATVDQDCLPNQLCDTLGRCVQCIDDTNCGPGTLCNTGTGSCYSELNRCESDADCNGGKRCAPATSECVVPFCEDDGDCQANDARQLCELSTFTCYLPSATCVETDEPNNTTSDATALSATGGSSTLCRGDVDFLTFPIVGDKRYEVTIQFPDFNVGGTVAALLGTAGTVKDQKSAPNSANKITLVGISGETETGDFTIRITGSSIQADQWAYAITIVETDAPDIVTCEEEQTLGIEPNDVFALATVIAPGTATYNRCNNADVDFYRITVPPQNGIHITVQHDNAIGDLAATLYRGPQVTDKVSESDLATGTEIVSGVEGPDEFYLQIALSPFDDNGTDGQPYTLIINAVPRPAACDPDINEPADDDIATAGALVLDTTLPAIRCNAQDVDHHAFTLPASTGGVLRVDFTHSQGDLRLELLNPDGSSIATANASSNANGSEQIELPFGIAPRDFVARISLNGTTGISGQTYSIAVNTYDAGTCVASEPESNNDLFTATCVGPLLSDLPCPTLSYPGSVYGPDLATCDGAPDTAGCGTICGVSDFDWYRVGRLNDGQFLRAKVTYDPAIENPGRIGLEIKRANSDYTAFTTVAQNTNSADNATIELSTNAPSVHPTFAREYAVVVRPEGAGSFTALPYSIEIEVSAPCIPDESEPNENATQTTNLRVDVGPYDETFDRTLCGSDTDVFELFVFSNETLTATLAGPPGLAVNIGEKPSPLTIEAPTLPGGEGAALPEPCPISIGGDDLDAGVVDGGGEPGSCLQATATTATIQQLYVTVKRLDVANPGASVGPYTLHLTVAP